MVHRALVFLLLLGASPLWAGEIEIMIDIEEAEAVLEIADRVAESKPLTDPMWERLWRSPGYQDLKYREEKMGVGFTDAEFRDFVQSEELIANRQELRRTLTEWAGRDIEVSARRALDYLPERAEIHATVFPLIKPKRNSFVFTTPRGRAIFLYLDPETSAAAFENTVTHELHHIGYSTICSSGEAEDPSARQVARDYLGAFGEGYAMLAASGDPDTDPHATSPESERAVWERNLEKVPSDIKRLERFFSAIMDGTLTDEVEIRRRFFEFVNTEEAPQGAFYTVGWTMASTIERERGREALVSDLCDPVSVLEIYQDIASDKGLATWSDEFLRELRK